MEHSKVFKISLWYGGVKELDNLVAEETIDLVEPETTGDDVKDLAVAAKYASEVERMLNHAACRTARKHLINWKGISLVHLYEIAITNTLEKLVVQVGRGS